MLDKLRPTVGLKGITSPTGVQMWVNDLPGVSTELVENLTSDDAADAAAVWAGVQRRAGDKLLAAVEQLLADGQDWQRFLGESGPAMPKQPRQMLPASPGLVGLLLNVSEPATLDVVLEGLEVWAGSDAVGVPVVAFDLGDGEPFAVENRDGTPGALPATVDLVAGYNRIDLGGLRVVDRYKTARLFVGLDLTAPLTPSLLAFEPTQDVPGLDFEDVLFSPNAVEDSFGATYALFGHGVHVLLSVECSAPKIIERHLSLFVRPWWNFCGAELLREKVHSSRTNYFTLSNLALTQDNLNYLSNQATAALKAAVRRLPAGQACQVCDPLPGGVSYDEVGYLP